MIDTLVVISLSAVLMICWGDNAFQTARVYSEKRDARSLGSLLIAMLLALASLSFLIGAIAVYALPADGWILDVARGIGVVVRAAFFVAGLVIFYGWRRD